MPKISDLTRVASCALTLGAAAGSSSQEPIFSGYKENDLIGMLIHRVEYYVSETTPLLTVLNTTGDDIIFGLQQLFSDDPVWEPDDIGLIDFHSVVREDLAAPAADVVFLNWNPVCYSDFRYLPDGGFLVHPLNFFFWARCDAALGAATALFCRAYYTQVDITQEILSALWAIVNRRRQV